MPRSMNRAIEASSSATRVRSCCSCRVNRLTGVATCVMVSRYERVCEYRTESGGAMQNGPSRTAAIVAVGRGQHRLYDAAPWVFDDPYALSLVGPDWPQIYELITGLIPTAVRAGATAALLVRARFAEDRLLAG